MLKFPKKIKIKLIENFTHKPIEIPNIILSIRVFAIEKNDYFLGPFFSNENGEFEIDKNMLEIFSESELKTGIMDYQKIDDCSPQIEIRIMSIEEITNLLKGRELWGLVGRENIFFKTKEELLKRIKKNNNSLVFPQAIKVTWDKDILHEITYEITTDRRIPK